MPTALQEKAFKLKVEQAKSGERKPMGQIMKEAGYAESTSRQPDQLTKSKSWQEMLSAIDEQPVIDAIVKDCFDKKDKRNAFNNRQLLMRLKDRFPKDKTKLIGIFDSLSSLEIPYNKAQEAEIVEPNIKQLTTKQNNNDDN